MGAALLFGLAKSAPAQPLGADEIPRFLLTATPRAPSPGLAAALPEPEAPRFSMAPGGFLRSVGAPPGQHFPSGISGAVPAEVAARQFLSQNRRLFGLQTTASDFRLRKNRQSSGRSYVRLQQLYQGLPLIAAETVVQVDDQGGIECVLGDLVEEERIANAKEVALTPALSVAQAVAAARAAFPQTASMPDTQTTIPELAIFDPSVLDEPGAPVLVWDLEISSAGVLDANARVLVSAVSGQVLRVWPTVQSARDRKIYDANSTTNNPGTLVRVEGYGASGVADADNAYVFLGDTYDFYLMVHGRDSLDDAGLPLSATVRYCAPNGTNPPACPPPGLAFYSRGRMYFGTGFVADDVTAHELTHGVTAFESGLIYTNASGAINESFSDIWGEFVDLGNGRGTDTAAVRWLIGEDLPGGALRSMTNPPAFGDPDRLGSPLYQPPSNTNDFGGVHRNSGVNNKLCCLLTDGGVFNDQVVYGLGITRVAKLYYEVQVNLLTSGAGWTELYDALTQAAINLAWNTDDRNNLYRACQAVEIATPGRGVYVDKNSTCGVPFGLATCVMGLGPWRSIGDGLIGTKPGDTLHIRTGNYNETMSIYKILTLEADSGPVTIGQ
ncbi:MAG TPA: M4 family metallopeptidase [Verrucomicrobiota bacterium]|nr:M4 family metallopeptidase [Verrucomicrobiota bacterium]